MMYHYNDVIITQYILIEAYIIIKIHINKIFYNFYSINYICEICSRTLMVNYNLSN